MSAEREWEPGDPLYHRTSSYQGYFYNFRDVPDNLSDICVCPDRAGWPAPEIYADSLDRYPDELEKFIAEYHEWKEQERG